MKRAHTFLYLFLLVGIFDALQAQGFPTSHTNWTMPVGGHRDLNLHFGYNSIFGTALTTDDNNSESWGLIDLNGDALPDLVVTAAKSPSNARVTSFSPSSNPYWKVYFNNGNGFATSATNWTMPVGGYRYSSVHYGYTSLSKVALTTDDSNSESWGLVDINGDALPDLVVTAAKSPSNARVTSFSPGNNPYWKVYFNNGNGFATSATNWTMPVGGFRDNSIHYGYTSLSKVALSTDDSASETWNILDINGDGLLDLVVSAQTNASSARVLSYNPGSNPYWRVFFNNGSGFATSSTHWPMPVGGQRQGNIHYGYVNVGGVALTTDNSGSETWNLADINGDGRTDLIVSAQTNASSARVMSYNPSNNPYWRVFFNSGSAFATSATYWYLPVGGKRQGNIHYGYVNLGGVALPTDNSGSENWALNDLNGDGRVDMVITAQTNATSGRVLSYNPGNNPYWRVFYNNGTAFSSNVLYWDLPVGGTRDNNTQYGYVGLNGTALTTDDNTSQTWNVLDMSGDGQPDLVVSAQTNSSSRVLSFSPGSNPYWKVYVAPTIVGTAQPAASALRLSPNPASSALRIDFPEVDLGSTYTIISLSGKAVRQGQVDGSTTTLDIQDLPAGMYFVRVGDGQARIGKFVKQ